MGKDIDVNVIKDALTKSVGSLIYTDFISRMVYSKKHNKIYVPNIESLRKWLNEDGFLRNYLYNYLSMRINGKYLHQLYGSNAYKLIKSTEDKIKEIFSSDDLSFLTETIPNLIIDKLKIKKDNYFIESQDKCVFDGNPPTMPQISYILDETILHLVHNSDIPKKINNISGLNGLNINKFYFNIKGSNYIVINNKAALFPIIIDESILTNKSVYKKIEFVTSIIITDDLRRGNVIIVEDDTNEISLVSVIKNNDSIK